MNKWLHRTVGTVGIASGLVMLAAGAAQAQTVDAKPAADPQQLSGMFDDLFTPTGGAGLGAAPVSLPTQGLPTQGLPLQGLPTQGLPTGNTVGLPMSDALGMVTAAPQAPTVTTPSARQDGVPGISDLLASLGGVLPGGLAGSTPADGGLGDLRSAHGLNQLAKSPAADVLDSHTLPALAQPDMLPALIGDALAAEHPNLARADEGLPLMNGNMPAVNSSSLPVGALPQLLGGLPLGGLPLANGLPAMSTLPLVGGAPAAGVPALPTAMDSDAGNIGSAPADAAPTRTPGNPTGRGAERPVFGEDADFS